VIAAVCTVVARASSGSKPSGSADSDPLAPGAAQTAVDAADAVDGNGVQFGVGILDLATGAETLGKAGSARFYCASVLKLFLITDLLHQQEQGTITLDADDDDDIRLVLTESNDAAMDSLWESYDGPAAINALVGLAHLQDTQVPADIDKTGEWGETLISARDVLAVYQYVLTQLNATDRNLVVGDLNNANPVGYQNFDQAFGLLGPTRNGGTKAKQGWMSYQHQVMLHTTGILDGKNQIVVAILSARPGTLGDYQLAEQQLDKATAALVKSLGPSATS
jgi:CubicO group peptidase (beta-lactamase class C family)